MKSWLYLRIVLTLTRFSILWAYRVLSNQSLYSQSVNIKCVYPLVQPRSCSIDRSKCDDDSNMLCGAQNPHMFQRERERVSHRRSRWRRARKAWRRRHPNKSADKMLKLLWLQFSVLLCDIEKERPHSDPWQTVYTANWLRANEQVNSADRFEH